MGAEGMKILECSKCHHLFKSTTMHIMLVFDDGNIHNYCRKCAITFIELAKLGAPIAETLAKENGVIHEP